MSHPHPETAPDNVPRTSLLTVRAALFVVLSTIAALWPVWVLDGRVFTFADSAVYLEQGERIRATLLDLVDIGPADPDATSSAPPPSGGPGAVGGLRQAAADADSVRSIPYAAFVGTLAPLSHIAVVWVQSALVMLLLYAVLATGPRLSGAATAGHALAVLLTPLPFVASLMMPDLLGAAVILYGLLLVRGWERLTGPSRILASLAVVFAVLSHYGNIPLAAAILAAALAILAHRGRRLARLAVAAGAVVVAALLANAVVAHLAFGEVSVTPRRFPILLARSIEDGPARWYLEDSCPAADYALCDYWGADIPGNVGDALWGGRGMENAPPGTYDRIRAEETTILWQSFRRYPLAQIHALGGNAVRQLVMVDPVTRHAGGIAAEGPGPRRLERARDHPLARAGNALHPVYRATYLAGALALVVLAWRGGDRHRGLVLILGLGLLANAAIFGGLSAPDGRYQARVAWLVPLLALALGLEGRRAHRRARPA